MIQFFRYAVLVCLVCSLLSILYAYVVLPGSTHLADIYAWDGYNAIFRPTLAFSLMITIAYFGMFVGLYRFSPFARTYYVYFLAFIILLHLTGGYRIASPYIGALGYIMLLAQGAILVLLYAPAVADRFQHNDT